MSSNYEQESSDSGSGEQGNRREDQDDGGGRLGQRTFRSRGARRSGEGGDESQPATPSDRPPLQSIPDPRPLDRPHGGSERPHRSDRRGEGRSFGSDRRGSGDRDRSGGQRPPQGKSGFGLRGGRPSLEREQPRAYLTPHQERERRRRERMLEGEDGDEIEEEDEFNKLKGGRQALRKKKRRKVRVFFHRRLTRITLPKLLTKAHYLSPFLARQFVESGRVKVNARAVTSILYEVNLRKERVTIDDMATEWPRRFSYMVYHKPRGVLCERGDPAFDELFDPESTWCFPFGRLSRPDSGLVIVSNDPRMRKNQHFVDDELQKEYRIRINRHLTDAELSRLRNGVLVRDDYFVPLRIVAHTTSQRTMTLDITVLDDPYTQIYPALKAIGVEPLSTRRTRIGFLNETMVPHAEWRELSGYEIQGLQLGRFTPGELPPEPDPEPRVRFQRPAGRPRFDRARSRARDGSERGRRDDRSGREEQREGRSFGRRSTDEARDRERDRPRGDRVERNDRGERRSEGPPRPPRNQERPGGGRIDGGPPRSAAGERSSRGGDHKGGGDRRGRDRQNRGSDKDRRRDGGPPPRSRE